MSSTDRAVPCFVDCEASSLKAESYPIEVAWSNSDGSIESHLIRPHWSWTDWDDYAEGEIHHISRDVLRAEGRPAKEVATRMNEALDGRVVYTDAPEFDGHWIARLFEAADLEPAFTLGEAYSLIPPQRSREAADALMREARS